MLNSNDCNVEIIDSMILIKCLASVLFFVTFITLLLCFNISQTDYSYNNNNSNVSNNNIIQLHDNTNTDTNTDTEKYKMTNFQTSVNKSFKKVYY